MSVSVFDSAALIALERGDLKMWKIFATMAKHEVQVVVPSTVIAQVWRGTKRQASLARALQSCSVAPFDVAARAVGELCGRTKTSDICDAHVALVASVRAESVYTGDPEDIERLLSACRGARPVVLRC